MAALSHDGESPTAPLSNEETTRASTLSSAKESPVTPLSQEETPLAQALSPGAESPVAPLSQEETALVSALSPGEEPPVAPLSQWLQLMLAEIARKREALASAHAEAARRELEAAPQDACDRHGRDYVSAPSEGHGPQSGR